MASKCYILAGDVMSTHDQKFPMSRSGWTAARQHAYKIRNGGTASFVTFLCPGKGGIPLYQCYPKQECTIEGSSGDDVLAGARRRSHARRRR